MAGVNAYYRQHTLDTCRKALFPKGNLCMTRLVSSLLLLLLTLWLPVQAQARDDHFIVYLNENVWKCFADQYGLQDSIFEDLDWTRLWGFTPVFVLTPQSTNFSDPSYKQICSTYYLKKRSSKKTDRSNARSFRLEFDTVLALQLAEKAIERNQLNIAMEYYSAILSEYVRRSVQNVSQREFVPNLILPVGTILAEAINGFERIRPKVIQSEGGTATDEMTQSFKNNIMKAKALGLLTSPDRDRTRETLPLGDAYRPTKHLDQ